MLEILAQTMHTQFKSCRDFNTVTHISKQNKSVRTVNE